MQNQRGEDTIEFDTGYRLGPEGVHLVERQMLLWQMKRVWSQGRVLARKTKRQAIRRVKGFVDNARQVLSSLSK